MLLQRCFMGWFAVTAYLRRWRRCRRTTRSRPPSNRAAKVGCFTRDGFRDIPSGMKPPYVLTICGLDELADHNARGVSHVLSILDPGWPEPEAFWAFDPHMRTTLHFHDAIEPAPGIILPRREDVEAILNFGRDVGDDLRHLLIHCHAGISRSTAAMTMILAQAFPNESEDAIADRLVNIRPQAWPNSRMIGFADEVLGREGRLSAAVAGIYTRRLATRPDLAETMRRLNRAREVDLALSIGD